jgi:prefoldin subunit 5
VETTAPPAYDPSNINLGALDDIDVGGFSLDGLGVFQDPDAVDAVVPGSGITRTPTTNPDAWVDVFNDYSNFLGEVEGGDTADKVNRRDDIYNNFFDDNAATDRYLGDPSAFRASVGLSDAFSVYDSAGSTVTSESLQGAYEALRSGTSPAEALSAYYGFEVQPTTPEGSNYNNVEKYGTDAQRMAEFQSLAEPILQKSLPYIQATQGLSYTDALEYAYTHDPMLAALYQSYGVDLFRQTKDGSTYIYDPIAGQEIRTLEVKDAKFKDVFPSLVKAGIIGVATAGIGSAIGGAIASSSLGATLGTAGSNALGSAIVSGVEAAATGGDFSDVLTSMATAGALDYGLNALATNTDIQDTLNKFGEEMGFGTSVVEVADSGSFVPAGLTEQGLTGGSFTGSLGQLGADTGKGLGDVLGAIGNAIANPSWTPVDLGDANVILNFANEVAGKPEAMENLGISLNTLRDIATTAAKVYEDSVGEAPKLDVNLGIELDPEQTEPVTVDVVDDSTTVTTGLPAPEQETVEGGGSEEPTPAPTPEPVEPTTTPTPEPVEPTPPVTPPPAEPVEEEVTLEDLTGETDTVFADTTADDTVSAEEPVVITANDLYTESPESLVARQIHEAILNENDPEIKDKLIGAWENYTDNTWQDDYNDIDPMEGYVAPSAPEPVGYVADTIEGDVQPIYNLPEDPLTTVYDTEAEAEAAASESTATILNLQDLLKNLEKENTTITGKITEVTKTADTLSTKLNTAQSELSTLQSEYDKAVESNASNVKNLEGKIEAKESEITDLSSELSDATSTISELESSLADAQAATEAAIAEGVVNTEEAERVGYSGGFGVGYGEGYGEGKGLGLGAGIGLGLLSGQGGGGGGGSARPATAFTQDLNTQLTRVQLPQPTQAKDYLAELLARLQA